MVRAMMATNRKFATCCVLGLMVSIPLVTSAAPMDKGAKWGVFTGVQIDVVPGRDPGDRDDGMMGMAAGPEVGLQYWVKDWLAMEGALLYQSDERSSTRYDFSTSALRLRVGTRVALTKPLSPHLGLGLAYERFRSEWGTGTDELDSAVATIEAGLSYGRSHWSVGIHVGFVYPLFTEASVTNTSDPNSNWPNEDPLASTGNIGLRLGYSF